MIKFDLTLRTRLFEGRTQCGIGRHAARNGEPVQTALFHRNHSMLHQHVADCLLERGRHVGAVNLNAFHLASVQIIQHGRFQAAEAEVVGGILEFRTRKRNGLRIALFGNLINLRTARIAQANGAGHFIKGLSGRVVTGPSQNLVFSIIPHNDQMGMSAGYHQAHKGRLQIKIFDIIGGNVAFNVVYAHQGQLFRVADSLGLGHSHQKRTYQTRAVGDADSVQIVQGHICCSQGFLNNLIDALNVLAGRDFRNYTAVESMQINLGGNNVGEHFPAIFYHGSRCLVAGALNSQYIDIFFRIHRLTHFSSSSKSSSMDFLSFPATARGNILRTSSMYSSGRVRDGL